MQSFEWRAWAIACVRGRRRRAAPRPSAAQPQRQVMPARPIALDAMDELEAVTAIVTPVPATSCLSHASANARVDERGMGG